MPKLNKNRINTVSTVLVLVITTSLLATPIPASAAKVDADLKRIFDGQLCKSLGKINSKVKSTRCRNYTQQERMDKEATAICTQYKKQLKKECEAYSKEKNRAEAPSTTDNSSSSRNSTNKSAGSTADKSICSGGKCMDEAANPNVNCDKKGCDWIQKYVNPTVNLLSLLFGLIAAASIIVGGIQYQTSAADPQKISLAKDRIRNTLLAVVAYMFLYSFLQFLVPGGVFGR